MTNAIERMMKEYLGEHYRRCLTCSKTEREFCPHNKQCQFEMPKFTAEKQIELIEYLAIYGLGWKDFCHLMDYQTITKRLDITEALAKVTIEGKRYLDNAKVKEILEG